MIQAGLDFHYMLVDNWKTFVVVEKWKKKGRQTIFTRSVCAKMIGYSIIDFFKK